MYIDTTFCVPQAMFIPSRDDTTNAAVDLIHDWLSRCHGNHIVYLRYRADLGYENLFVRFSLEFNMKVSRSSYNLFCLLDNYMYVTHIICKRWCRGFFCCCSPALEQSATARDFIIITRSVQVARSCVYHFLLQQSHLCTVTAHYVRHEIVFCYVLTFVSIQY